MGSIESLRDIMSGLNALVHAWAWMGSESLSQSMASR